MRDLPRGRVTLLFTDVESSTELLERLGERYGDVLDAQRALLRRAVADAGGREIDCRGEEFLFAFASARAAVEAASAAQRGLAAHAWPRGRSLRVRMGIHTGEPAVRDDGYLGLDVHRGARICGAAHGGQILVSQTARELANGAARLTTPFRDLGEHRLKGLERPERIFQLVIEDLPDEFPRPQTVRARSSFFGRELEVATLVRAAGRSSVRLERLLRRLRRRRGLAELGWQARSLAAGAPAGEKEQLSGLADELLAAARTVVEADEYLGRIDRKGLSRLLREHRELGVLSKRAAAEAESYARQLADIERLYETRAGVAELTRDVKAALAEPRTAGGLRDRVRTFSRRLDHDLGRARNELGEMSLKLRRTLARGVYRLGSKYAVPCLDDLGVEERREFETMTEARRFRHAIRTKELAIPRAAEGMRPTGRLTAGSVYGGSGDHNPPPDASVGR